MLVGDQDTMVGCAPPGAEDGAEKASGLSRWKGGGKGSMPSNRDVLPPRLPPITASTCFALRILWLLSLRMKLLMKLRVKLRTGKLFTLEGAWPFGPFSKALELASSATRCPPSAV